jgi:hypothetical protein
MFVAVGCNRDSGEKTTTQGAGNQPYSAKTDTEKPFTDDPARYAYVAADDPLKENVSKAVYLEQNWKPHESVRFYFTAQGSQIIPYTWFLVLKRPDSDVALSDKANMLRYRFLAQNPGPMNPDGLPVGFVADRGASRLWLGMTCAACHTAEIRYNGIGYRVDGAPSQADVQGLFTELVLAMRQTLADPARFATFAAGVFKKEEVEDNEDNRASLRDELNESIKERDGYNQRNFLGYDPNALKLERPTRFGRLDAVDAIVNEVFWHAVKDPSADPKIVAIRPDALVSYPCLWDTPKHFKNLEWIGIAKSGGPFDFFSLARNVGEVLGVFGNFEIPDRPSAFRPGYASSVKFQELRNLENWISTLYSPTWPDAFPKIVEEKRAKGQEIFEKRELEGGKTCVSCHYQIKRDDPNRDAHEQMYALETSPTDRTAYDNFFDAKNKRSSGKLNGVRINFVPFTDKMPPKADADSMVRHVVIGVILGWYKQEPPDRTQNVDFAGQGPKGREEAVPYKARPLNGIWATAPYLHNGSVPTLDALLRKATDRPKSFPIGVRTFDPVLVGYLTEKKDFDSLGLSIEDFPKFNVLGSDGKPIVGNSNEGHEFGAMLEKADREALIEYLKSL